MSTYPMRRGEIVQTSGRHGWTIYEAETDSLHVLNATAKAIWELCDGNTSPSEMVAAISEVTGENYDRLAEDIANTIARLRDLGLLD